MKKSATYYRMFFQVAEALAKTLPLEKGEEITLKLLTIRQLAKKHHRLAEMDCNGEGWIRGQRYYCGKIDDYAQREYGAGVKSAYVAQDTMIFDVESDKVEAKIKDLVSQLGKGWAVEFQGDPRGNTVKVSFNNRWIDLD